MARIIATDEQISNIVRHMDGMIHCHECGVRIRYGDIDCPRCGADIEELLRACGARDGLYHSSKSELGSDVAK